MMISVACFRLKHIYSVTCQLTLSYWHMLERKLTIALGKINYHANLQLLRLGCSSVYLVLKTILVSHHVFFLAFFCRTKLEAFLLRSMEDGLVADGVIAQDISQASNFWRIREVVIL